MTNTEKTHENHQTSKIHQFYTCNNSCELRKNSRPLNVSKIANLTF